MNKRDVYLPLALMCSLLLVTAFDENLHIIGPDRVQEFHACVGTSAYIPWPLNVISRSGHKSTAIKLTFQRRHSESEMLIATLNGHRDLKIEAYHFRDRLSLSSENSGIFLDRIKMEDTGTYFARAHFKDAYLNGQKWTRATNLTVHLRPIIYNNRLNVTQSEVVYHASKHSHCVNITCGTLEYAGYPPAKYVWTSHFKTLSTKVATDDSASSLQVCSPFVGDVTCSIAGFSSLCTHDHMATVHLNLPGPDTNATVLLKSTSTQDLVLTIVMPILAVLVPLTVLGIWVLSHILKSYPRLQEQQHPEHPVDGDIEDNNMMPCQAPTLDDESEADMADMELKEEIYDSDEENVISVIEVGSTEYGHNLQYQHNNEGNRRQDHENAIVEHFEHRMNEEQPLMNQVIGTIV